VRGTRNAGAHTNAPFLNNSSFAAMSEWVRLIARLLLTIAQVCAVAYVALVTWLMSVWMVSDHWAAHARGIDWWVAGLERLLIGVFIGALVGYSLLVVNRALAHWSLAPAKAGPSRIGLAGASVVVLAALIGTVQFIVTHPYM
jgi:hypothetical protein